MKKLLSVLLVVAVLFGLGVTVTAQSETEIPEGYTPIYTAEDLNNIRNNLSGKYILMNDIDLSVYENWEPIGTQETPFMGELDGSSMAIKNFTIKEECTQDRFYNFGLFGYCKNSTINNVCVINADIEAFCLNAETAKCRVGIIVGFGQSVTVTNCVVEGTVTAKDFYATEAGGIAGRTHSFSSIINCVNYSDINVTAAATANKIYVGGVAGVASGRIEECCNFGEIYVESDTADLNCEVKSGGINGSGAEMGLVSNCYNRGNLIIDFAMSKTYVGGISGDSFIIDNSYNTGKISVPENFDGYAGAISGNIGIYGGYIDIHPYVENVYFSEAELTVAYAGKIHPDDYNEEEFEWVYKSFAELSDSEMRNQSSFAGFDFEAVWAMEENGYPVLQNQPMINVKEEISLEVGETFDGDLTDCEWSIEDENIVNVDENNNIIALSAGETILTVEIEYGYSYEYTITVTEPEPPVEEPTDPTPPVEEPDKPDTPDEPDEPDTPDEPDKPDNSQECYLIKVIRQLWSSFKWAVIAIFDTIFRLF